MDGFIMITRYDTSVLALRSCLLNALRYTDFIPPSGKLDVEVKMAGVVGHVGGSGTAMPSWSREMMRMSKKTLPLLPRNRHQPRDPHHRLRYLHGLPRPHSQHPT